MASKYKNNIRKEKRGGYSYKVTVAGKQHHGYCKNCTTRDDALKYVVQLKADLLEKDKKPTVLQDIPTITVDTLCTKYEQYTQARNGDLKHVKSKTKFFKQYFGAIMPANNIKRSDIDTLINYLRMKNYKDTTIDRYISALSKMYNLIIDDDILIKNPCAKIKKLGLYDQNDFKSWKRHETEAILKVAPLWLKDMIDFALITGLRRANIRLFNRNWINWESNRITVPRVHSKSKKPIIIPMGKKLKDIILRNLENNDTEYVFINRSRRTPRAENTMEYYLKQCCISVDVEYYGWHGFRHTVGTRMAENGTPIQDIQDYMGYSRLHGTFNTTNHS